MKHLSIETRVFVLAYRLEDGPAGQERFEFFSGEERADGSPLAVPYLSGARTFPTPGAAYRFAHHRPALQTWVVIGHPRLVLPRYRGAHWLVRREAAA